MDKKEGALSRTLCQKANRFNALSLAQTSNLIDNRVKNQYPTWAIKQVGLQPELSILSYRLALRFHSGIKYNLNNRATIRLLTLAPWKSRVKP